MIEEKIFYKHEAIPEKLKKYGFVEDGGRFEYRTVIMDETLELVVTVESISFEGGKFDGQKIVFSNELNTLIGIRGSGKSSILESIRYIFDQEPKSDQTYKQSLITNIFESGGKATVILVDKHGRRYTISRILGEKTTVLDEQGNDLNVSPISL